MRNQIRPVVRPRLYETVARQIAAWVDENQLGVGDRLPPERELASSLGVSRTTVSQALVAMEVVGAVAVRHGDGVVITSGASMGRIADAIREHARRLPDVLDARDAIETKLAALAAARRTDADLAAMDAALEQMAADVERGGRGVEGDERFHAAVTSAARSGLLSRVMLELTAEITETRIESLGQPGRPNESLDQHRRIADAIRRGDADAAAAAMHAHVTTVSDLAILRES
ncbi:FadR/GntR family transcriptional regulator [Jiangella anatolica]|uniref:GntR family transcriptional regulator n=1 Tax=Jiangella anatolica TaxID=2670374 RepID=A0A2W2BED4_9ACTN|nr:FCD domain-containing protein [Jiangella anatolica]PZF83620.1 GntR family transcriptional regulator [Jiangella anatolica]